MASIVKTYGLEGLYALAIVGLGFLPIWYSSWEPNAKETLVEEWTAAPDRQAGEEIPSPDFWDVVAKHAVNFRSPVPYTIIVLAVSVVGGIQTIRTKHAFVACKNKRDGCQSELRKESNGHGETKQRFDEALNYLFENALTKTAGFDNTCRVTIYRHLQNDSKFQLMYRYTEHGRHSEEGRFRIPDNEGFVGAAWWGHGTAFVDELPPFDAKTRSNDYRKAMREALDRYEMAISDETLNCVRMQSRCYYATRIANYKHQNIAVVVFESTEPNKFNREQIEHFFQNEQPRFAEYIIIKTKLDEQLNPDPNGEAQHG